MRVVVSVLGVVTFVFVAVRLTSDPVALFVTENATREEVQEIRVRLGLDEPIYGQYLIFLSQAVKGDFGDSLRLRRPAMSVVFEQFPRTALLAASSITLAVLVGVPAGVLAAVRRGSWLDRGVTTLVLLGQAMPNFWLGIMLVIVFSVHLGWLPTSGTGSFRHLVLPTVTLAGYTTAAITRLVRNGMLEVIQQDYVRTARSKGLGANGIVWKHAFRNAVTALLTFAGLQFSGLIGGAVVTEAVFAWPGVGRLLVQSIASGDYPMVQAGVIVIAGSVIAVNTLIDFTYILVDPRIRVS